MLSQSAIVLDSFLFFIRPRMMRLEKPLKSADLLSCKTYEAAAACRRPKPKETVQRWAAFVPLKGYSQASDPQHRKRGMRSYLQFPSRGEGNVQIPRFRQYSKRLVL